MKINEIITEAARCWDGYKREGTKLKGGRRVPNCVKESNDVGYDNWDHSEPVSYARYLEKTFGEPDELTNEQAIWHNIDGFKRVVCKDEYIMHASPAPHYDFVYSYIDLEIPENLSDELAECSGSILIDHLKNEVGARCASLTANAVTLNFCLDVVAGRTQPTRDEYEYRIKRMTKMFDNGKHFKLDWWPDVTKDTDPKNPYYKEAKMNEDGRIVKGVNTTVDVGPNEIKTQSAKFGNKVDKDGNPPSLRTNGKVTEEKYTLREWAAIQGGHAVEDIPQHHKLFDWNKY